MGRIQQEAGRYDDAFAAYAKIADRYPGASVAGDARWRAGWVRYLAGEHAAAAAQFHAIARRASRSGRVAAEYWEARALEQAGDADQAAQGLAHVAERHGRTYYGGLAAERIGRPPEPVDLTALAPAPVTFPTDLPGPHGERAQLLASLGLTRFARRELAAVPAGATEPARLFDAYTAIEAPGAAVRLARSTSAAGHPKPLRILYPLAFWPHIREGASDTGLDPLLIESLIRQESMFEPAAVSPADAHGLMQLLPGTAREVAEGAGRPLPDRTALHDPAVNVELGTVLLHRLVERHGGSRAKALAAYNAGDDAVAKWERRYPNRPEDEFVELISFRETRDYVKAVLGNYQTYRWVYRDRPSTTSAGSPPNAPFDMITMTSPGAADSTR
jgi:soluble lytic murein transglycosylase